MNHIACNNNNVALHNFTTDLIAVKPRWLYNEDSKDSNTASLPDSIELDLELQSGKITLNLIKQSRNPIKPPLIITESEGQSSIWRQSEQVSWTNMEIRCGNNLI